MTWRGEKLSTLIFAMNKRGISCEEIARKVGVSRATVFAWRNDQTEPKFWTGVALVEYAESRIDELSKTLE